MFAPNKQIEKKAGPILSKIDKYLKEGCYFGFNIDLTRS